MTLHEYVTDAEFTDVLDGVKDLLKETYHITDREADSVLRASRDKAEAYVQDYTPYLKAIKEIRHALRETLDTQFEQAVDPEQELRIRMSNDAAVWVTFECIRRFCKNSVLNL
ncbi:hypothetical protein [Paenibacillus cremeus]|uniref:Uncharacterized protein n=1 Tax=Paenibacillus cremeus TaxID=2163881 RepID=A0A559KI39_9BACL|nr:hypothetical protein [Paenibacillus cremeus]TVY11738.1 hypothetical protein FPZ49_00120 [Paenibacillus cremeus]